MNLKASILGLAALIVILISVMVFVSSQVAETEWIVSLEPSTVYVDQPVVFKAYAHNPRTHEMYYVACNITVVNATDVVLYDYAEGAPAVKAFSFNQSGVYSFRAYCVSSVDEENLYLYSSMINVLYPTPTIEYGQLKWGRPVSLKVRTPYPYNGYTITVSYAGSTYSGVLVNGEAVFTLPPIMKPENLDVVFLDRATSFTLTPEPPVLQIRTVDYVKAGLSFPLIVELVDSDGFLDYTLPVILTISGDCYAPPPPYYTRTIYNIQTYLNHTTGACTVTATSAVWSDMVVSNSRVVSIIPQTIVSSDFKVANTTEWSYQFTASVVVDSPVNGSLKILINDVVVAEDSGVSTSFRVSLNTSFLPGTYFVRAVFSSYLGDVVIGSATIEAPKYPYVITPPPPMIYAGETFSLNADYYVISRNETTLIIHAIYPGDELFSHASQVFVVKIIRPKILLNETRIEAENLAPGASLSVFCKIGAGTLKILELYATSDKISAVFPRWVDCEYVYAVYKYKSYEEIVFANEPESVTLLTNTCLAGENCVLLAPSSRIVNARIGITPYKPGTSIRLPSGYYTLIVEMRDGTIHEFTIIVRDTPVKAVAIPRGDAWVLQVQGPPWAEVRVALASGLTLTLGVGTHTLFSEPVSVYWQYGSVDFVKYKLVR